MVPGSSKLRTKTNLSVDGWGVSLILKLVYQDSNSIMWFWIVNFKVWDSLFFCVQQDNSTLSSELMVKEIKDSKGCDCVL